jgi:hypothetical protein
VAFWRVPNAISVGCNLELNCIDSHRPFPNRIEAQPTLEVIRNLALALDAMPDELVFDKTERQPQMVDKELLKN